MARLTDAIGTRLGAVRRVQEGFGQGLYDASGMLSILLFLPTFLVQLLGILDVILQARLLSLLLLWGKRMPVLRYQQSRCRITGLNH